VGSYSEVETGKVTFIVTEVGIDTDPFVLHIYAALAKGRQGARREAG